MLKKLVIENIKAAVITVSMIFFFLIGANHGYAVTVPDEVMDGIKASEAENENKPHKQILIITSQTYVTNWFMDLNSALLKRLYLEVSRETAVSYEYISGEYINNTIYREKLVAFVKEKYRRTELDAVIAVMPTSSQFLLDYGREIFPGVPVVYTLPSKEQMDKIKTGKGNGIVKSVSSIEETIDRIRMLLPETEHIVVVSGSGQDDLQYMNQAKKMFEQKNWPVKAEFLTGLTCSELGSRLGELPERSVVLMLVYLRDRFGNPLTTLHVMDDLQELKRVPVFGFYDTIMGHGIVGGRLTGASTFGEAAAENALKLMSAETPGPLIITMAGTRDIYDWRQLQKWGIPESRLPEGSEIRYREVTFVEQNIGKIIVLAVVIILQFLLIAYLLVNRNKRKQAEIELIISEKKYRDIFDNAIMGIFQSTADGRFNNVNTAFAEILGYRTPQELIESIKDITNEMYFNPEVRELMLKTYNEKGVVRNFEVEVKRKDGSIIWLLLNGKAVRNDDEEIIYYEGTVEDVTERKKIDELRYARDLAQASARAKSDFLANMSHEIRTPMNSIIGFSSLALKTALTEKQRDYLTKISSSAKSLLGIINDILDFSKIEAGKLDIETVEFNLNDVMNSVSDMFLLKAAEKGIELIVTIGADVPCALVGDPLRLTQVLTNLVGNALKFTRQGFVIVKADLLRTENDRCRISFIVDDSGIGMTEEQMSMVFSTFTQGDSSITRRFGGTGLGLTISKRLIEMMGGKIAVNSMPGKGTFFIFTLEFGRQPEEREIKFTAPSNLSRMKVLVVDDSELSCSMLAEVLNEFGFEVNTAGSGEETLRELESCAESSPYRLLLIDWKMPGLDGIETVKRIKKDGRINKMPYIIMITAYGREDVMSLAEKAGINGFLMKPVNASLLFNTIMDVFGEESQGVLRPAVSKDFESEIALMLRGTRVLLAEDNPMNQQVATEILESAGILVDVANNGREAVDAVARGDYDLVLMDIQMKEMGGYEALKIIRSDPRNAGLPVIAMTAHAMAGAREECISAGMDDYVSKPVDPAELFSVLIKQLKPGEYHAEERHLPEDYEWADFPEELPGFSLKEGRQRVMGNSKLYRELITDFFKHYTEAPSEIKEYLVNGDYEHAGFLAHTVKGVAGNIAAMRIYEAAGKLEKAIFQRDGDNYEALISEFDSAMREGYGALKILENYNNPLHESESAPSGSAEYLLRDLASLINGSSIDALKKIEELKKCDALSLFKNEIEEIAQCLDRFDFKGALVPLEKIAVSMNISTEVM